MMDVIRESSVSTKCVPDSTVKWRNWKDFQCSCYKVPSKFEINSYHVFRSSSEEKGVLFATELSTPSTEVRLDFNKVGAPRLENIELIDAFRRASWRQLSEIYSKQHGTRGGYLLQKGIDAYHYGDDNIRSTFFASG